MAYDDQFGTRSDPDPDPADEYAPVREYKWDLIDRLDRAVARLEERIGQNGRFMASHERQRLEGKIDGVKLALSYLR